MSEQFKVKWDEAGKREYEAGVSRGVLYTLASGGVYDKGVAWNGLTNADENPSGGESTPLYANNKKYAELDGNEEYGLTLQAFTYPKEFEACDGTAEVVKGLSVGQQARVPFGFAFRTEIGNDEEGLNAGYKLNLVYGCKAKPSARTNATIGESPEAATFSWEVTTTPVDVPGYKAAAKLTIDSRDIEPDKLKAIEQILYGTGSTEARLPLPAEIMTLLGPTTGGEEDIQG